MQDLHFRTRVDHCRFEKAPFVPRILHSEHAFTKSTSDGWLTFLALFDFFADAGADCTRIHSDVILLQSSWAEGDSLAAFAAARDCSIALPTVSSTQDLHIPDTPHCHCFFEKNCHSLCSLHFEHSFHFLLLEDSGVM